jgi:hypothetical protein
MRKTTIQLTDEQYFFLKEKVLELQKRNQNASFVSVIRGLIEKDRLEWDAKNANRNRAVASEKHKEKGYP